MNTYKPIYAESRALIIGINKYRNVSPLSYAVHDAKGVAELLISNLGFKKENVKMLLDERATKNKIMRTFLSYVTRDCVSDDRLFFFFAGHGYTMSGKRQEVGFLIPVEGNIDDLSSLIRWDELTRNGELIPAKHILYVMDACYGGLALTRGMPPGSARFLNDMIQRYSRQVITAGKADEKVADSGGPIPNHSVFTGHFIEALRGKAETGDKIITAQGVMSYVYEHVSKDPNSKQTPHFGFLDGDGDFIFKGYSTDIDSIDKHEGHDTLIDVPVSLQSEVSENELSTFTGRTKELLSDTRNAIKLQDMVNDELRKYLSLSADDSFKPQGQYSKEELLDRMQRYEIIVRRLQILGECIAHWGESIHLPLLEKLIARMSDRLEPAGGLILWLNLKWYPIMLVAYSSGIAAIASGKYEHLANLLQMTVYSDSTRYPKTPLFYALSSAASKLHDAFKNIPGLERHYVPQSEYLFKYLQPYLDDILFLGRDYEECFDRFEIFLALVCQDEGTWGPLGRFAWKFRRRYSENDPYRNVLSEAERAKEEWTPLKAGMFHASYETFTKVASEYAERMNKLGWF